MRSMIKPSQMRDEYTIVEVFSGQYKQYTTRFWDDGFGQLWIYRDAGGLVGIVRAQSWESAYECCQDEIFDDGTEEYAFEDLTDEQKESGEMNEGYGYRNNGQPSNPALTSYIYAEDLNGSFLEPLTDAIAKDLGVILWVDGYPQGLLPPETSRFDVIGAYYLVATRFHSGQSSKGYEILCRCLRHLGGNLDALETDESIRCNAASLLRTRRKEIKRRW